MGRDRVLIVEDETDIVSLIKLTAEAAGFETHSVGAVDQIADAVAAFNPTALLVDLSISGGTGAEVMRPLVPGGATVPLVIMSGSGASAGAEEEARSLGLTPIGRLDKPFRRAELRAVLDRLREAGAQSAAG